MELITAHLLKLIRVSSAIDLLALLEKKVSGTRNDRSGRCGVNDRYR